MIETFSTTYKSYGSIDELIPIDKKLLKKAEEILEQAYSVYSGFSVGAAALLDNGEIIVANNQENIAYPSSMCAERVLFYFCKSNFPNCKIEKVAITVKAVEKTIDEPISPCGACRQVMFEYERNQQNSIKILLKGEVGKVFELSSIEDLLPLAFKTDILKRY
ncbi:MAG: cytidine deaminase [Flavobacteriales bacterium]|jgi:cytidine deaminase|tara:strand:+ start:294 stop:782 length:489 start_codon:yes stop_codon:yes gene_type:complete